MRRKQDPMAISEGELSVMTADLVDMHEATWPTAQEEIADLGADLRARHGKALLNRRSVMAFGGVGFGAVALAACGSSSKSSSNGGSTPTQSAVPSAGGASAGTVESSDVMAMVLDASLENLAVFAYGAAITAAGKGTYGTVPPALADFAKHAMDQHAAHAQAFNAVVTGLGGTAYTMPNPALAPTITQMFSGLKTFPDVAKLALTLENTAGQTYTKQAGEVDDKKALGAVATIAPIEQQHAAILNFVLGSYPVPVTFVTSNLARSSSDIPSTNGGANPSS